ncbi:hypothetical protein CEXT_158631 [Caerostris extrusa]|uniref:Uncharacterized protein n=1 Tax=Caerostris extrusa TaxID=172846 RepID=A0AAV4UK31_CAEEX|nr:hypothetical protein CEXT_158631 [Caerostris extrusa]
MPGDRRQRRVDEGNLIKRRASHARGLSNGNTLNSSLQIGTGLKLGKEDFGGEGGSVENLYRVTSIDAINKHEKKETNNKGNKWNPVSVFSSTFYPLEMLVVKTVCKEEPFSPEEHKKRSGIWRNGVFRITAGVDGGVLSMDDIKDRIRGAAVFRGGCWQQHGKCDWEGKRVSGISAGRTGITRKGLRVLPQRCRGGCCAPISGQG